MSPDPMESLFAQFSHLLVEEGFSLNQWRVVVAEFGVNDTAQSTHRFYRSWKWGDDDRQANTIRFLQSVYDEDEDLVLNLMRRAYTMVGGADEEQLQQYPALEALEEGDAEGITIGLPHVPVHTDLFLDLENVPGQFYPDLVEDINQCYRLGIYDATLVLTRKLLENLLIDILRREYGTTEIQLYYDPHKTRHLNFNRLINNFENNLSDFEHLSGALGEDFIDDLNAFRQNANAEAHSIETNISENEINEYRDQARFAVRVLFRVFTNM